MANDVKEKLKDSTVYFAKMRTDIPETRNAFVELLHSVHKDGALSAKFKELICVAISLYSHCEGCIIYHTKNALEIGATRAEIMEACSCAIMLGGGPVAFNSIPTVMKTIEAFSK
jgi:AhpD family alkylhydroperoxidase